MQIHNITISSTPHRTLNTSRGIIRYRDEDLDNLSDEEICNELAPQGVIHVKRFITNKGEPLNRNESGRFGALKSDSTHHFFRNACAKSGSLRFSQFSGC
jgi:hypothetical protein